MKLDIHHHHPDPAITPSDNTNTTITIMSAGNDTTMQQQAFDFFGLARELRDMIYDHRELLEKRRYSNYAQAPPDPENGTVDEMIAFKPSLNLLRSCRQIYQEYKSRPAYQPRCIVRDTMPNNNFDTPLPPVVARSHHLELHVKVSCSEHRDGGIGDIDPLDDPDPNFTDKSVYNYIAEVCQAPGEVRSHVGWCDEITAQMPMLRSVEIKILLCGRATTCKLASISWPADSGATLVLTRSNRSKSTVWKPTIMSDGFIGMSGNLSLAGV